MYIFFYCAIGIRPFIVWSGSKPLCLAVLQRNVKREYFIVWDRSTGFSEELHNSKLKPLDTFGKQYCPSFVCQNLYIK